MASETETEVLQILNLSAQGANVELLDRTVDMFYGAVSNEQVRWNFGIEDGRIRREFPVGWAGMVNGMVNGSVDFSVEGTGSQERGAEGSRNQRPVLDRPCTDRWLPGPRISCARRGAGAGALPRSMRLYNPLYPLRVLARSLVHAHALTDTLARSSSAHAVRAGAQSVAESPGRVDAGGFYSGDDAE